MDWDFSFSLLHSPGGAEIYLWYYELQNALKTLNCSLLLFFTQLALWNVSILRNLGYCPFYPFWLSVWLLTGRLVSCSGETHLDIWALEENWELPRIECRIWLPNYPCCVDFTETTEKAVSILKNPCMTFAVSSSTCRLCGNLQNTELVLKVMPAAKMEVARKSHFLSLGLTYIYLWLICHLYWWILGKRQIYSSGSGSQLAIYKNRKMSSSELGIPGSGFGYRADMPGERHVHTEKGSRRVCPP